MNRKTIFLMLVLLLNAVGCTSLAPSRFKGISTTWADYPTKPDPMPAEADWYVKQDSSYAEVMLRTESRSDIDIPSGTPLRFFWDHGEWQSKKLDGWTVYAIQRGDSLFVYRGLGESGVTYELKREVLK